jgi:hypothetical protein
VKALTVQQPWAWAIVHGGKDVENRTQAWSYRGPLAIHAGARYSERGQHSPMIAAAVARVKGPAEVHGSWPPLFVEPDRMSAIVGVVDLVDVHTSIECVDEQGAMCSAWAESSYDEHGGRTRRDVVHLVLERPRTLPEAIPCRGALGLWTPPADVVDAVLEQLVQASA